MGRLYDLVAFDVDGTLIGSESQKVVWQLLNEFFSCDPKTNEQRYKAYLRREITYAEWVDLDVQQWVDADATRAQLAEVITSKLYLMPGARQAVDALQNIGYRLVVISGTLDLTLDLLFPDHPFDEVFTNKIWFDEEQRIAGWKATPYDMEGKAEALLDISKRMGIPQERTVYVGDNVNDLQVLEAAGLSIAYEPKHPSVEQAADHVVREDLRGILAYLGAQ
ncbi:MAG: HAD family phosphatase [Pseudomonadota bacterium]